MKQFWLILQRVLETDELTWSSPHQGTGQLGFVYVTPSVLGKGCRFPGDCQAGFRQPEPGVSAVESERAQEPMCAKILLGFAGEMGSTLTASWVFERLVGVELPLQEEEWFTLEHSAK